MLRQISIARVAFPSIGELCLVNLANRYFISFGLFLSSLALFYFNMDFRTSGDSLVYADIIANREFDNLSLHFGYYLLVLLAHRLLGLFQSAPLDEFLVYFNVFAGALTTVVAYWLANHFLKSHMLSALCVAILALSGKYFMNATSAEIYISQTLFILLSFWLFTKDWPILAGASAVISLLISPLSAFCYLFIPTISWIQKYEKRRVMVFGTATILLYGIFLGFFYQELFWGKRGLLNYSSNVPLRPVEGVLNYAKYSVKHFGILAPFAVIGSLYSIRKKEVLYPLLAIFLPHFYVIAKLPGEDQVHVLTLDFFFALLIVLGFMWVKSKGHLKYLLFPVFLLYVTSAAYLQSMFDYQDNSGYKAELKQIHEGFIKNNNACIITSWWDGIAYKYYNKTKTDEPLEESEASKKCYDIDRLTPEDKNALTAMHEQVYVLESYSPSRISEAILGQEALEKRYSEHSLKARVERMFDTTCQNAFSGLLKLYSIER